MNDQSYHGLVSDSLSELASGMSLADVAFNIRRDARHYRWPSTNEGWRTCLEDLVSTFGSWELLFPSLAPLVGVAPYLTWHRVFQAVGLVLKRAQDRFAFVQHLLLLHQRQQDDSFVKACLANLGYAGINPVSLQVCGDPILGYNQLTRLISKSPGQVKIQPISYNDALSNFDMGEWLIELPWHVALNGLITNSPTRVVPSDICSACVQDKGYLGNRMLLGGDFVVHGWRDIVTVGSDIHVYGNLELVGLESLIYLGNRITVEGHLTISGCPYLLGLPADLRVGGMVRVISPHQGFHWGEAFPKTKRTTRIDLPSNLEFEVPSALKVLRGCD
jgi:hypothetical protein